MNNVEALDDFLKLLKEIHPNIQINERDKMLLGMAINHAYLIKREEINELRKEIDDSIPQYEIDHMNNDR